MSKLEANTIAPSTGTTLTLGESGDTVQIGTGATNSLGITVADQWRLSAGIGAATADITTNLERVDGTGQGTLGSAMTESSGIFTFPATGIYKVEANLIMSGSDSSRYCGVNIQVTTNNSAYNIRALNYSHLSIEDSGTTYSSAYASTLVDVTDVANVKVKFGQEWAVTSTNNINGNTDYNGSTFTFTRLGDT